MHEKFITTKGKSHPIKNGKMTSGLTSKQLGADMKTPTTATIDQIKEMNTTNGKFRGFNLKSKKMELIKLENIGKAKNGAIMLKGTSSKNGITVVKIVSSKIKN